MILPAISVRQPWAWAMLFAGKDRENRSWNLPEKFRNTPALLHASQRLDSDGLAWLKSSGFEPPDDLTKGGIVGLVTFVSMTFKPSIWSIEGLKQWEITGVCRVEFWPCRGAQGFFYVDYPSQYLPDFVLNDERY